MQNRRIPLQIIILDDDKNDSFIISYILKKAIPRSLITLAYTRQDLKQLLYKSTPDLVISDVNLGPDNGFSVAEDVRKMFPRRPVPFIFMSGFVKDGYISQSRRFYPGLMLTKPMCAANNEAFANAIIECTQVQKAA